MTFSRGLLGVQSNGVGKLALVHLLQKLPPGERMKHFRGLVAQGAL
jgi:hypothetical protein